MIISDFKQETTASTDGQRGILEFFRSVLKFKIIIFTFSSSLHEPVDHFWKKNLWNCVSVCAQQQKSKKKIRLEGVSLKFFKSFAMIVLTTLLSQYL